MLRFSGRGVSDVGRVRPHNEDSGFVGPYAVLVADGVGGAAAGEIASATAAYSLAATALGRFGQPPVSVLAEGAAAAMAGVRLGVQRDLDRLGMATTLTAVVTDGQSVAMGHVGDSRAYLWRDGSLQQLSRDHTYVQHLVESGRLSSADRATHPWRNVVLRSIDGDPDGPPLDVVALDVCLGDRLLLCSDGLSDLVEDSFIADVLGSGVAEPAVVLTEAALLAGGRDNVTTIVVEIVDGPVVVGDGQLLGALSDPRNVVDAAAVRLPPARV